MSWSRRLKRLLASTGSFIVSFVYSALSLEMGRGYAEYLPATPGPDPELRDESDQ